ncbi:MAG TPA: aminotransferase class V-fold PLP-dependent enzyme [Polyangiaceae bacterium]|nr:aminotransferase class V-fold PLP-dependent enzyme [Polyangiaceae bacterium]
MSSADAPFDVAAARDDLPSARACAYLNAGTFGPLPRAADRAMREHLDASFEYGRRSVADWLRLSDEGRRAFARSLGAREDDVALTHCTTDGVNAVVFGLGFAAGDEIVTTTHEHPGLTAPLEELARVTGAVVREVEPRLDAIASAMTARTRLVALSHVLWTTGEVLPLAAVAAEARARGALVLVDGAQAVGCVEVDPAALGVDFYTVSGQKWLCGPSGTGALWVSPAALGRLRTPWPWFLSKSRGPAGVHDWPGARRLDSTTVSMTALAGAAAALAWHRGQVERGALAWSAGLARSLRARLAEAPGVRVAPAATPSTIVSFTVEGERAASVAQRLEAAGVFVRSIPGYEYVRASVGFWNDEGDLDAVERALRGA